jgi:hypothetical protein
VNCFKQRFCYQKVMFFLQKICQIEFFGHFDLLKKIFFIKQIANWNNLNKIKFTSLNKENILMYIRVEWFAFFEKFKNPVVLKVAYSYCNQLLFYNFLKFWDLPLAHRPRRDLHFHSRVKFLVWPTKWYGNFSGSKLLAGSKNMHGLYTWRSTLTAR